MRRTILLAVTAIATALVAIPLPGASGQGPANTEGLEVLVFSETAAFRHGSIPAGVAAIEQLGADHGFSVEATEDSAHFNDANLARFDAVIWLSTTGDVLTDAEQAAFERFVQGGGGYVGIHAASDTEYDWPWYADLVGAYFGGHPAIQEATLNVDDRVHPATDHLPARWTRTDEWYSFTENPRSDVHVLMTIDEGSYDVGGNAMGYDHPMAWCHDYDGGHAFYTALGHTDASYSEAAFLEHVLGGIYTAGGVEGHECGATDEANFTKVPIAEETMKPIRLEAAPDGRIFYLEQAGQVMVYTPETDELVVAADFVAERNIYNEFENGTVGITFDPDFTDNGWVYLYYTPRDEVPCPATERSGAACGEALLSRFTMVGDTLDLDSEEVLLRVQQQRDTCCHTTGDLTFDAAGNLYLSTGDDTNPWESSGYTPIDERANRNAYDAQRTSANTNDLRGKIIRIHPEDDGTYTIPEGNLIDTLDLSEEERALVRPEIYAMGMRNPFTIDIDPETQALVVAEYGPDASSANPTRGPEGQVELNYMTEAGNYGWPYCIGENTPFLDYTFLTNVGSFVQVGVPGVPTVSEFDCANPVNDSPNNTGLTQLPPAKPAELVQSYQSGTAHRIYAGRSPMTGPFFDASVSAPGRGLPAYYDGAQLYMDWNNGNIFEIRRDEDRTIRTINPFLDSVGFIRPQEMVQGADGTLYVSEWGNDTNFFGPNSNSGVYRIEYHG